MKFVKSLLCAAMLIAPLSLTAPAAYADDALAQARQAYDAARPGTLMHNPYKPKWNASGPSKRTKIVPATGIESSQAYQIRVKKRQPKPWDINLSVQMDTAVKEGDKVVMSFWARAEKPVKGTETADFTALVGRNKEPWDTILSQGVKPGTEWQRFTLEGIAESDFGEKSVQVSFQLGNAVQTVEFGPFYVSNLGQ